MPSTLLRTQKPESPAGPAPKQPVEHSARQQIEPAAQQPTEPAAQHPADHRPDPVLRRSEPALVAPATPRLPSAADLGLTEEQLRGIRDKGLVITGKLGQGGMGEVFQAIDTTEDSSFPRGAGQSVALKKLQTCLLSETQQVARFNDEASAMVVVRIPNVIHSLRTEYVEGVGTFFTMRIMEGGTLEQRLSGCDAFAADRDRAFRALTLVGRAVGAVHRDAGLIHRDIKPGNILFDRAGEPYLSDFGCVCPIDAAIVEQKAFNAALLPRYDNAETVPGFVMGTPLYLSPEQLKSEQFDERVDQYALGVILHRVATGKFPHNAATTEDLMNLVKEIPARPARESCPTLHPALGKVIDRMIAHDPESRYPTMADAMVELERAFARAPLGGRFGTDREADRVAHAEDPNVLTGEMPVVSDETRDMPLPPSSRLSRVDS